ncbi:hypothetical protein COU91_04015 [Candidatus Saccharibacteria bacterium CG10_big_fil_rev_8_21_14_0_10_47_8]|nr:MAG: hypothetical protein COU91_04015 [Candidatus Saccharibacteria bacterium CG10_big_fil_rev_8_21_14_0_10_47_8]
MAKTQRKTIDKVFVLLGILSTVMLLVIGSVAWWGYSFATNSVRDELSSQKIYFPPKGSPSLDPSEFPDLQKYAGQLVDNGPKAKAYANGFIGRHVQKVADGKTYAEVSTLALKDPSNQKLQQQKQTLFQGETLRGLLLSSYVYWTFGMMAQYLAVASLAAAAIMAVLVYLGLVHMARLK